MRLCTSCGAVYCNRSCLCVGVFVDVSVNTITRNCVHMLIKIHQTGFVSKGSDRLQLIKFWPPRAPGKGVCSRAKNFGSLTTVRVQCLCLL